MTLAKPDLKHDLRALYTAGLTPRFVDVPRLSYLMLDGRGDPHTAAGYAQAVSSIYAVARALKSALRCGGDGRDLTILPLEALWWSAEKAPPSTAAGARRWDWTLLLAVPEFVTEGMLEHARECAGREGRPEYVTAVRLGTLCEGPCAQLMHIGADAQAQASARRLHDFIEGSGRVPVGRHHEIYLSDPDRTAPHRLKTLMRQPVAFAGD